MILHETGFGHLEISIFVNFCSLGKFWELLLVWKCLKALLLLRAFGGFTAFGDFLIRLLRFQSFRCFWELWGVFRMSSNFCNLLVTFVGCPILFEFV